MSIEDVLDRAAADQPQKDAEKPTPEGDDGLDIIMPRGIGEPAPRPGGRDEEGDDEDERLGASQRGTTKDGDDDEDSTEGRPKSKKAKHRESYRDRKRQAFAALSEVEELRKKLADLEARSAQHGQQQQQLSAEAIRTRYGTLEQNAAAVQARIAAAVTEGRGDDAVKAFQESQAIQAEMQNLSGQWQQIQQAQKAPAPKTPAQSGADDPVSAWMEVNDWFDPDLGDKDSRRAKQIDDEMAAEGRLRPGSPAYMIELTRRIALRMGHVYEGDGDDDDERPARAPQRKPARGGPPMSGGNGGRRPAPSARRQIDLNEPMYRDAIQQMGIENDPAAIKKWAAKWADWRDDPNNQAKMALLNTRMGTR